VTYTPTAGYAGSDSFTYRATDNHGAASSTATASIFVNATPTCSNTSASVTPGASHVLALPCSDANTGEALTLNTPSTSTHGTITPGPGAGNVTYTPAPSYHGPDNFTFTASDAHGATSSPQRTATLTVDTAPVCSAPSDATIAAGGSALFNLACSDADSGDPLTLHIVSAPSHGTLDLTDLNSGNGTGSVRYTPASGFGGTDQFTFKATDGQLVDSNVPTATVHVQSSASPPAGGGSQGAPPPPPALPPIVPPPIGTNPFQPLQLPHVGSLRLSSSSFRARRGPLVRWSLDLPARVSFQVMRCTRGCARLAPTGRPFSRAGNAGANSFRLSTRSLAPGSYRLVGTPLDAAGHAGPAVTVSFRVRRN
jgi:hypothetical protein